MRALDQIDRFARHGSIPVLLEGESGTGKTMLAHHVHQLSPRAAGPFQRLMLSAVDDTLAGSELFGHVSGAYTDARANRPGQFASANHGTLFLDEIAKASTAVQQKLLHAIEYGEIRPVGSDRSVYVDVRIIAATNVSLRELVAGGGFLPDLHARLEVFRVHLPPLRERRADIPILVLAAIDRYCGECGYALAPSVTPPLMSALQGAPWPNNLRQLDSTVRRLLIEAEGSPTIDFLHCRDELTYLRDLGQAERGALTRDRVNVALADGNGVSGAARLLGVDRTTIHRHLRKWREGPP